MDIVINDDPMILAEIAADIIENVVELKPQAVIGLATGSSPLDLYNELVRRYEAGRLSFAQCKAFMLDEYVGIAEDHPERYRNVIEKNVVSRLDFRPEAVHGPAGNAEDLWAACRAYDEAIAQAGGTDVQILGIGSDGHIAFNEPGGSLVSRTHPESLTEETRQDNARFFNNQLDLVPTHCLTQGLATIMTSKHPLLLATGEKKAKAIAAMVEGPVSAACPASILQMHPQVTVLIDEAAASLLERRDYYRRRWNTRIVG